MPEQKMVSGALNEACAVFREAGIETPELDAKLLLQQACGFSDIEMISRSHEVLSDGVEDKFQDYVLRRLGHEPVHRILASREFYGREFCLSQATLIPRPDTETLIETVLENIPGRDQDLRILEIGTGSGIIAITLAAELSNVEIIATDISKEALATASENAMSHGCIERIRFLETDMFERAQDRFDLIVSNPPYIPTRDIRNLQKEVQLHDPVRALDGGENGLDFYQCIFETGKMHLKAGGSVIVEIGMGQEKDVMQIAEANGFCDIRASKDINGTNRVVSAVYKN